MVLVRVGVFTSFPVASGDLNTKTPLPKQLVKMVEGFNKIVTSKDIVASPVDEILDGVTTTIEKGLLKEFIDEKYHEEFDNLDQEHLLIHFEVKFNNKILKGNDRLAYYAEPMSNTKMAKFITKYDELKAGQKIKVIYNAKGFGKIKLD